MRRRMPGGSRWRTLGVGLAQSGRGQGLLVTGGAGEGPRAWAAVVAHQNKERIRHQMEAHTLLPRSQADIAAADVCLPAAQEIWWLG